jgi:hypothetical protein
MLGLRARTERHLPVHAACAVLTLLLLKNRRVMKIDSHSLFLLASFLNGCFNFDRLFDTGWRPMSHNMPSLNRVLATAALASVIVGLLMSYQWGRAAEPPITKVIRLHPK